VKGLTLVVALMAERSRICTDHLLNSLSAALTYDSARMAVTASKHRQYPAAHRCLILLKFRKNKSGPINTRAMHTSEARCWIWCLIYGMPEEAAVCVPEFRLGSAAPLPTFADESAVGRGPLA